MEQKHKAINLFILIFGIILTIFLFTQGTNIYKGYSSKAQDNWQPSIDCIGYIYGVNSLQSDELGITFNVQNKDYSEKIITNITVKSDTGDQRAIPKVIIQGGQGKINLEAFRYEKNFTIFPDNCELYAKTCFPKNGQCISYEPGSTEQ
jgi:hypothetical protein